MMGLLAQEKRASDQMIVDVCSTLLSTLRDRQTLPVRLYALKRIMRPNRFLFVGKRSV
jgi:hypothetical protein